MFWTPSIKAGCELRELPEPSALATASDLDRTLYQRIVRHVANHQVRLACLMSNLAGLRTNARTECCGQAAS